MKPEHALSHVGVFGPICTCGGLWNLYDSECLTAVATDPIRFLRRMYDEDEAEIREAHRLGALADPTRMLADIVLHRALVDLHIVGGRQDTFRYCGTCGSGEPYEYPTQWPCRSLFLLLQPYAGREGWREEWAL
ncbi:MAG: hypothetical protein HOV79_00580 [Hamadaea sp.]|nr:hypothetical protein [Hamadaea sp.]